MSGKMIVFLLLIVVFLFFFGFNLGNETSISFGFYTLEKVPIAIGLLAAYSFGAATTILAIVTHRLSRRRKEPKQKVDETVATSKNRNQKQKGHD